jgi:hypothetical protein
MEYQNQAGYTGQPPPLAAPRDTLHNKLVQTKETLALCEGLARQIAEKLHGPGVDQNQKEVQEPPQSVSSTAMDVQSKAMRLRDALEGINNFLA